MLFKGTNSDPESREALLRNKLFVGMSIQTVDSVTQNLQPQELAPGTEVLLEGDGGSTGRIYLIVSGSVSIAKTLPDTDEQVLATLGPSEFFGEMSIPEGEFSSAKVSTIDRCTLLVLERGSFARLCAAEPTKVVENLIRTLGARLRSMNEALIDSRIRQLKLAAIGSVVQEIVHDLKSPLSVVLGVADLLDEGSTTASSSKMLRRASQAILGLVEDILAFASDKPRRPQALFSLKELLGNIDDFGLAPIERRKAIRVRKDYHYLGEMFGDHVGVERALLNLIKNAHEAMPAGGELTVSTSDEGDNVRFIVSDTGPGIPEAVKQNLFRPFVTLGKAGGSGLGLPMVKRVVDAHGGQVDVQSGPGGTQFVLDFPREKRIR
jgi:signal transduction histidine kinase